MFIPKRAFKKIKKPISNFKKNALAVTQIGNNENPQLKEDSNVVEEMLMGSQNYGHLQNLDA